jgi:hypothetical protein
MSSVGVVCWCLPSSTASSTLYLLLPYWLTSAEIHVLTDMCADRKQDTLVRGWYFNRNVFVTMETSFHFEVTPWFFSLTVRCSDMLSVFERKPLPRNGRLVYHQLLHSSVNLRIGSLSQYFECTAYVIWLQSTITSGLSVVPLLLFSVAYRSLYIHR